MSDDDVQEETEEVQTLVGLTIVAAKCVDSDPDNEWSLHETYVLTLSDGRRATFGAWFYDAGGATFRIEGTPA